MDEQAARVAHLTRLLAGRDKDNAELFARATLLESRLAETTLERDALATKVADTLADCDLPQGDTIRVSLRVPRAWAVAIQRELRRKGYTAHPRQVRAILAYCLTETGRTHWWLKRGARLWRGASAGDAPQITKEEERR